MFRFAHVRRLSSRLRGSVRKKATPWLRPALVVVAIVLGVTPSQATERMVVIDGDTLQIDGKLVDLAGIDAPELGQLCRKGDQTWSCGEHAAWALHKLVNIDPFVCSPWANGVGASSAGRDIVVCRQGDRDLGEILIREGYATADRDTFPSYLDAEYDARNADLGIWGSQFDPPADWRSAQDPSLTATPCPIMGIRDDAGKPVYYVPTDPGYVEVEAADNVVEKRFCSDEEAAKDDWRHFGTQ